MDFRGGIWVIFGRVVIHNDDGDDQNSSAYLRTSVLPNPNPQELSDYQVLDATQLRLPGKSFEDIGLQGTLFFGNVQNPAGVEAPSSASRRGPFVELVCSTYDGTARDGSLIALEVGSVTDGPL
jgi:hypothetical protein